MRWASANDGQPRPCSRVVLADSVDLMRAGLRAALETDAHLAIVGEACDMREAVGAVQRLGADLLVLDVELPGFDGVQTLDYLRRTCPRTKTLLLGASEARGFVREARAAGAAGYLLKAASLFELRSAVRLALSGECPAPIDADRAGARLSPREIQVLACVARGRTNRQIGEELVITPHTVKIHIEHILDKLEVQDRTEAAVRAVELGYVRRGKSAA